jgi:DNA-nicking Smr family endonuclease
MKSTPSTMPTGFAVMKLPEMTRTWLPAIGVLGNLSFRRPGVGADVVQKLRKGQWSIQRQVDLHGLRSDEAREAMGQFIRDAHKQGLRCVRVVHGKGLGSPGKAPVLKDKVLRWLVQKAEVIAFVQAPPNKGGAGAVLVLLAPVRPITSRPA